jgi:hypothetical protein
VPFIVCSWLQRVMDTAARLAAAGLGVLDTAGMVTATAAAFMSAMSLWFLVKKITHTEDPKKRSMSFSSMTMVRGSFPSSCNVAEPVMNILTVYRKLPKEQDTKIAFKQLFDLYRFRAVPIYSKDTKRWEFHEITPNIDNHFHTSAFPTEKQCYEHIEKISQSSFEREMTGKPAWCVHRIINEGNGMSFVLIRVHHVIGDGIALVLAIDRVFTDRHGEKVKTVLPGAKYDAKAASSPPASPSSPSS